MGHEYASGQREDQEDQRPEERARRAPDTSPAPPLNGSLTAADVIALQRSAGNQATQAMLARHAGLSDDAPAGGKKPDRKPGEAVGGRTPGEALGDVGRPVGTALGNIAGGIAGALTGISIGTKDLVSPAWTPNGEFDWGIEFTTTGRNGWIVQEIVNTYRVQDKAGATLPSPATPHYWEAWEVDGSGAATPADGRGNDDWQRPDMGADTQGHWSMKGTVHWTDTDPATQGFAAKGVPDAGILLSTTSAPSGLGVARRHRYAQGTWDSTIAKPFHTGSAS